MYLPNQNQDQKNLRNIQEDVVIYKPTKCRTARKPKSYKQRRTPREDPLMAELRALSAEVSDYKQTRDVVKPPSANDEMLAVCKFKLLNF
jgi:hypothetical protein